jgi:hypothetical protein
MNRYAPIALADAVLAVHVAVILFNVFGLVAIPLGAWRCWRFVRIAWWRALHLAFLIVVAVQAVLGRACFLTVWWSDLLADAGRVAAPEPLIQRWVVRLIYWPLPMWVFAALYVAVLVYAVLLWWLVPTAGRRPPLARR